MRPIDADNLYGIIEDFNYFYRDQVLEKLEPDEYKIKLPVKCILNLIDSEPTIEPKRGHWIKLPSAGGGYSLSCSECSEIHYGYNSTNFCPNCGVDMREVKENANDN